MPQVTTVKVVEGDAHIVVRFDLLSDGSGELQDYVVLSPEDLVPKRKNIRPTFRLMQVWHGLRGFDVTIKSSALLPQTLWTIVGSADSHVDFRSFGGIYDSDAIVYPPSVDDGKLTFTTSGFGSAGLAGSIVLELRKTNTP